MYESERESIEAQYWDSRDQVKQRLLSAIEERRRKLRDEKEGGDVVTGESAVLLRAEYYIGSCGMLSSHCCWSHS